MYQYLHGVRPLFYSALAGSSYAYTQVLLAAIVALDRS